MVPPLDEVRMRLPTIVVLGILAAPPALAKKPKPVEKPDKTKELQGLLERHVGNHVTLETGIKDNHWKGSFSGPGAKDLAVLVKAEGWAKDLPKGVKVH